MNQSKSLRRHFHVGNRGSNPLGDAKEKRVAEIATLFSLKMLQHAPPCGWGASLFA